MQHHALVALREPEQVADLVGAEALDVAQRDDACAAVSGSAAIASWTVWRASSESAICSALPLQGRIGEIQWPAPAAGAWTKRSGSTEGPCSSSRASDENGAAARLANATRAGEVHDDAEEVGAERRAALERVEAPQEAEPGLLGDILGDLARRDVLACDAHERGVVAVDEMREGALVAGAQRGQQGGVVERSLRSSSS